MILMNRRLFIAAAALLSSSLGCSDSPKNRVLPGSYGGNHVSVIVELQRANFQFDCASGVIDGAIELDNQNGFDVTGTYSIGGNAQGVDHSPKPARYIGTASGDILAFSLFVPANASQPIDIYVATRGAAPQIAAC